MRSIFTGTKNFGGANHHKGRSSALAHARLRFFVAIQTYGLMSRKAAKRYRM